MATPRQKIVGLITPLLGLFFSTLPGSSRASEPVLPLATNQTVIGNGALENVRGVLSVNMAAGDANQQANARAISLAPDGSAHAKVELDQEIEMVRGMPSAMASTRVEAEAFRNVSGLIGVNQAAGVANRQGNTFTFSNNMPGEQLSDKALSEALPGMTGLGSTERQPGGQRNVSVNDSAFRGVRGIVQFNQSAGSGNSSVNNLGVRLAPAVQN